MKYEYYASNIPTHWEEVAVHKLPFLCLVSAPLPLGFLLKKVSHI